MEAGFITQEAEQLHSELVQVCTSFKRIMDTLDLSKTGGDMGMVIMKIGDVMAKVQEDPTYFNLSDPKLLEIVNKYGK